MERGGATYYYHFDGLGSVTALTDSTGTTVETYTYDIYGQPSTTSSIGNPYYFTGRRFDTETGLYHYRSRAYNPQLGRFLQTDPIVYYAGMNFYTYCDNDPVNWIDPYGLSKDKDRYAPEEPEKNWEPKNKPPEEPAPKSPEPEEEEEEEEEEEGEESTTDPKEGPEDPKEWWWNKEREEERERDRRRESKPDRINPDDPMPSYGDIFYTFFTQTLGL